MPFWFLNPWFWLGALALAAPIWLHLRRRREKRVVRFSAVRFLDDQPVASRQPVRLRDLLLFWCRALALLLLLAAFAWPYLRRADTVAARESRVYILDNTLSHQAFDGFQKDRDRLARELRNLPPEIQSAVIELTSTPRVIGGFGDPGTSGQVANLQPSFERGSYLAAFRTAADVLANSLGATKRIILLGDNQANQWTENVNSLPFLRNVEVELPRNPTEHPSNVALSEPHVQRLFGGDKSLIDFSVKLTRIGGPRKVQLRIKAGDQVVIEKEVETTEGTVLLQGQWEADSSQWLRGVAELEGASDALPGDDRVFFTAPPVREGQVLLLARSPYLRVALSPEIMRGHWSVRVEEPMGTLEQAMKGGQADVLCLESGYLQSGEVRELALRYLEAGHGVVLMLDRVTPAVDGFLRSLDFEVEGSLQPSEPERFQIMAANHRVFHPFASPEYGNLFEVNLRRYFKVRSARANPLLFSERGETMLFEAARQRGKLFLITFGLDREHTSWPVHATFIPFLDLLLQAACLEETNRDTFEPGETWALALPSGAAAHEVVISAAGKEVLRLPIEGGTTEIHVPERPGLFDVRFPGMPSLDQVISVNPSPKESELVYADSPPVLASWRVAPEKRAKVEPVVVSAAAILQQRYWWWMLLGGLVALMAEMALLVRTRRA